jgi:hypothetical protein
MSLKKDTKDTARFASYLDIHIEIVGTTRSGNYDQLRDIYSTCRWCWNVATYKGKVHNGKIEIIWFIVKFRSLPALIVNFDVYVKV